MPRKPQSTPPPHKVEGFFIPRDQTQINELITKANLANKTLHDLPNDFLKSGSEVTEKQFAMFRAACPETIDTALLPLHRYVSESSWETAVSLTGTSFEFRKYVRAIGKGTQMKSLTEMDADWPGSFKTVRELQEHATHFPGKKSYPNEITVNAAFIVLLQTITHLAPNIDAEWYLEPADFVAVFGNGSYEALTDGQLRTHSGKVVSAIAEVKRKPRRKVFIPLMQEVAELVAWIVCDPPARPATPDKCHFRLLLSQNESQIFITFAEFHHDYVDYLTDKNIRVLSPNAFIEMNRYGPWDTGIAAEMESLATILLAVTIELAQV